LRPVTFLPASQPCGSSADTRLSDSNERVMLPLAADGKHGDGVLEATVYQLGIRPKTSDKISIDHHSEIIDFFPLM
jgi:hypothetical protein